MHSSRSRAICPGRSAAVLGPSAVLALAACRRCLAAAFAAHAQSAGDPPGRAARLSEVAGQVWLFAADSDEWVDGRAQPAAHHGRPHRHRQRRARRDHARHDDAAPRCRHRARDRPPRRQPLRLRLQGGSVAARLRTRSRSPSSSSTPTKAAFVPRRSAAIASTASTRRATSPSSPARRSTKRATRHCRSTAGQHAQFWVDAGGVPQYAMVQPVRDAFAAWNDDRDRAEDRPLRRRAMSRRR